MATINDYLSDHLIKVGEFFADISEYVGYPIDEDNKQGSPVIFWYHRYSNPPDYSVEVTALSKGMIPIFNILNTSYSGHNNQKTYALNFQSNNNNCTIAMVQHFWGQFATVASAWDTNGVWLDYVEKYFPDTLNRIMMIDVEPPDASPTENSIMDQLINNNVGGKYGAAGTTEQQEAALLFVASQEKFQYALPDLRNIDPYTVPTTQGSLYTILPALGIRRINEATYSPTGDFSTISSDDVIGLRISVDGRSYTYTPESAKESWPGRSRMYFPVYTPAADAAIALGDFSLAAAEEVEMMSRL